MSATASAPVSRQISDMSMQELAGELKAERRELSEMEGPIGEVRDYCTMLDVMLENLSAHSARDRDDGIVRITIDDEEYQAIHVASILAKQASRALYARYHKLDGSTKQ